MREVLVQLIKRDAPLLLWITMGSSALLFVCAGYIWNDHRESDDRIHRNFESRLDGADDKLEKRESRITTMENGYRELRERIYDQETRIRHGEQWRVRH
jgi:hypothetical protein